MATNDGHSVRGKKFGGFDGAVIGASMDFEFDTDGIAAGKFLCRIPKGARILVNEVVVIEAFNAASTNVITVGYGASLNELVAAGDVTEGTPDVYVIDLGKYITFTEDKDIYVKYAQTGTAATTGIARYNLVYLP